MDDSSGSLVLKEQQQSSRCVRLLVSARCRSGPAGDPSAVAGGYFGKPERGRPMSGLLRARSLRVIATSRADYYGELEAVHSGIAQTRPADIPG
jgi:hypothetical protein